MVAEVQPLPEAVAAHEGQAPMMMARAAEPRAWMLPVVAAAELRARTQPAEVAAGHQKTWVAEVAAARHRMSRPHGRCCPATKQHRRNRHLEEPMGEANRRTRGAQSEQKGLLYGRHLWEVAVAGAQAVSFASSVAAQPYSPGEMAVS